MDYRARQKRLRLLLEREGLDVLLVTHLPNVRYLTGFTGSAGVLLATANAMVFTTDGRYREQAQTQAEGARVVVGKGAALATALESVKRSKLRRVGIEAEHVTVAAREAMASGVGKQIRILHTTGLVEELRLIKDADEIAVIREAVNLGAKLLRVAIRSMSRKATAPLKQKRLEWGTKDVRESDVAARLEYAARRRGATAMSFETIVAGGARSALPHGVASSEPLPRRGFVVLDYGVILNGYCSDMTRTLCIGRANAEERSGYNLVLDAQLSAIAAVAPGVTCGEVDEAARGLLRRAKLDRYFTHSTGHGVGLEIHEMPRIAAQQKAVLQPGMVITIEPGIYIGGRYGVRIEDMVLVTERGYEVLTPASKQLFEI